MMGAMDDAVIHSRGGVRFVEVATSVTPLLEANRRRVGLVIGQPSAGTLTVWILRNEMPTHALRFSATSAPLVLSLRDHGGMVQDSWFAVHSTGGVTIAVLESLSDASLEELCQKHQGR